MALKKMLDSLEGLDDGIRSFYTEKNGKFILDVDGGFEDVSGLKTALERERENARKAERIASEYAKKFDGLELTPEEIADLVAKEKERQTKSALDKGEFEKLKNQLLEKHNKEISAKDGKISALQKAIEDQLVVSEAIRAVSKAKGVADLLLPHIQSKVKVEESEDGKFSVRVMGKDGPRYNDKGEFMTIEDLVNEMKGNEIFGRAFEGNGFSGSGSQGSGASGDSGGKYVFITSADARNHQKYQLAKTEAQKAGKQLVVKD